MTLDEVLIDVIKRHKNTTERQAKILLNKSLHKDNSALKECIIEELETIERDKLITKKVIKEANRILKKEEVNFKI